MNRVWIFFRSNAQDKSTAFVLGAIAAFFYILPFLIFGEDSYVLIHDNLDSNVSWFKLLVDTRSWFWPSSINIPNVMNGLPRLSLGTEFSFFHVLYFAFSPFVAYVLNLFIIHFVAAFGSYRFITTSRRDLPTLSIALISLYFGMLPFWPSGGLTVAGIPLLLSAFLRTAHRRDTWFDWILAFGLPFYSSLILTGYFVGPILIAISAWLFFRKHPGRFHLCVFSLIFLGSSVLTEYRNFLEILVAKTFVTHRDVRAVSGHSLYQSLRMTLSVFISGHYHSPSYQLPILTLSLATLSIAAIRRNYSLVAQLGALMSSLAIVATLCGFWKWQPLMNILKDVALYRSFNFSRLYWMTPLLSLLLAVVCTQYGERINKNRWGTFVQLMLFLQVLSILPRHEYWVARQEHGITFRSFFATDQFKRVQSEIKMNPSEYRVLSLGIHPSIAVFNGFYSLDYYVPSYPVEYFNQFSKILAPEIADAPHLARYRLNSGNRSYLLSKELGLKFLTPPGTVIQTLHLNLVEAHKMGARYLISGVAIEDPPRGLSLVRVFKETEDCHWRIHLYKIDP